MPIKRPIVRYADTGRYEELRLTDTLPAAGGTSQLPKGVVTFTFGDSPGKNWVTKTILQSTIISNGVVSVSVNTSGTATHTVDEHLLENYKVELTNVIPGVSFDLTMLSLSKNLVGDWIFNWVVT